MTYYRLMTLLPALPDAPAALPMPLEEIIPMVRESLSARHWEAAEALLQALDCRNLESKSQNWGHFDERALMSRDQLDDRVDLPVYIENFLQELDAGSLSGPYPFEALWQWYYANLAEAAERVGSSFLREWIVFDVSLRNELAQKRGEDMGWDVDPRLLPPPHGEPSHQELMLRLSEAADPQTRQKTLDQARLNAIDALCGTDPFSLDAVLSYIVSALILDGWKLPEEPRAEALLEDL